MKSLSSIFILTFYYSISFGQSSLQVNIPSPQEEAEYIWSNIQDIAFFEQHNYELSLPQGKLINQLKEKSKSNQLSDNDFEKLLQFIQSDVYKKADYQKAFEKIKAQQKLVNKMANEIINCRHSWGFKSFDTYQINLTLYGPGGSYNPVDGSIIIYATPDGRFKQYNNPVNTLIHEIVHIGIEESIIGKYNVPHALKERIVDHIVLLYFKDELPDYRIQNMGDKRIDELLKKKKDIKRLDKIVGEFVNQKM